MTSPAGQDDDTVDPEGDREPEEHPARPGLIAEFARSNVCVLGVVGTAHIASFGRASYGISADCGLLTYRVRAR